MAQSVTQEYNRIVSDASRAIRHNNNAKCLLHHIKHNRVSLWQLKDNVKNCRGRKGVRVNELRRELEGLAVRGAVNIYLNRTYDLTSIGKKLLEEFPTDPLAHKD